MLKRLLYIFTLSLALTSFCQPAQASPDINIDEDVADEPEKAIAYRYWIDDNSEKTEVAFNGEDIETNIDVSDYSIGVHIYHLLLWSTVALFELIEGEWRVRVYGLAPPSMPTTVPSTPRYPAVFNCSAVIVLFVEESIVISVVDQQSC